MLSAWRTCCVGISQRWVFALMACFALWTANALRVILSITITEMVIPVVEITNQLDDTCANLEVHVPKNITLNATKLYEWDEYTQGIILSSFFWGYAATQFPFGALAERFGGKHLLGLGVLLPSCLTFLTPLAIQWGESTALIVLRVIMGVISGAAYPAASTMITRWAAPAERTMIGSVIFAGGILGTIFGTTMPAVIIRYSGMGWPAVFHFFGFMGIVWFPLWLLLCYNNPEQHPFISEGELNYLQENLEAQKAGTKVPPPPWRHILASKPFWAFVMALIGIDWSYYTMASDLPKYMSSVVRFSIEDNGYLSSLPYLCMWLNSFLSSWLADLIMNRGWLTRTNARKLLATISIMGPGLFILGASYAGCDQLLVVAMLITGMTLMGSSYPSVMVNALDLSPNYAGTLMALGNGIAALGGVLTPYIVGVLTPNQTIGEWRVVFWIVFVVACITTVYFLVYADGEVQPWNDPDFVRNEKKAAKQREKQKAIDEESAKY